MLSRLQSASEKRKIFRAIQKGEVDIVIGTHALFGKDLRFERLGLVIADEEHRFGVAQKEKLKSLSQLNPEFPAEYLAMSATPIPRTLHMALSGLREVSVIATPPPGRKESKRAATIETLSRLSWPFARSSAAVVRSSSFTTASAAWSNVRMSFEPNSPAPLFAPHLEK